MSVLPPGVRLTRSQRLLAAAVTLFGWAPFLVVLPHVRCTTLIRRCTDASLGGALLAGSVVTILCWRSGRRFVASLLVGVLLAAATCVTCLTLVGAFLGNAERGAQKRTMREMRTLARQIEALRTDAGFPLVTDAADLARLTGAPGRLPKDGWGHAIEVQARSDRYVIRSGGLCGAFETPDPWAYAGRIATMELRDDIVIDTGQFVRFPFGSQR